MTALLGITIYAERHRVELVHDHTELVDVERPVGVGVVPVATAAETRHQQH